MEKTTNKSNRIREIVILLVALVCAALVMMEMTQNLINEMDAQMDQAVLESTVEVVRPTPTWDPNYTPEPIIDA
jgi:hypothetical protein